MRISVIVLVCFGGVFAGHVPQDRQRGVLTDLLSGNKPGKPDKPTEPASGHDDDGCKRQYPLSPKNDQQLSYAFNRNGISPLLTAPPAHYLEVDYKDIHKCQPRLGNEVNVCKTLEPPSKIRWNCKRDRKYTLLMVDLYPIGEDRPQLLSQRILWWVVDIPGCDIEKGTFIYEYMPPLPFYGAGKSKYAFLVYEQPSYQIDWDEEPYVKSTDEHYRYYHCLDKLVNKYDLELVAGNFFLSEYKKCENDYISKLITPQYVQKAIVKANLPSRR